MATKQEVQKDVEALVRQYGLTIIKRDIEKPWGFELFIDEAQNAQFIETFFPDEASELLDLQERLSPKILTVAPGLRLSWQYHDRRSEFHKIVRGSVSYILSPTDEQPEPTIFHEGELVRIDQGTRHRFGGTEEWGVVAEIWKHTDPKHPSDGDDNHRLADDFSRKSPGRNGEPHAA